MIVTKSTPISAIEYTETIFIDKEVSLDTHFMEIIMQTFPLSKIVIQTYDAETHSSLDYSVLYNAEEIETLIKNSNLAKEKYNKQLTFDDGFSVEQAISASRKINDMAEMINNTNINGEPLSPLEKYTLAYSLVTNRLYTHSENIQSSRNVISVLTDDKIVCAGFASALAILCNKIGVPCVYRGCIVSKGNNFVNHANCIVRIEDDKYNIHGVYNADPTWDSAPKGREEEPTNDYNFNFRHFLIENEQYLQTYPNIALDRFYSVNENGSLSFKKIKIPNINVLYPEKYIPKYKNPSIFNQETHDIDINKIKQQAIARIFDSFHITDNPNRKHFNGLNEEHLFEMIIHYLLEETLTTPPEEKSQVIDFIVGYYKYLNLNYSVEEIQQNLTERILNLSDERIIDEYLEIERSNLNKNHYPTYMIDLLADKSKTRPVSKSVLMKLFKNLMPLLIHYDGEVDEKIIEEMVTTLSPLALTTNEQQKSQE